MDVAQHSGELIRTSTGGHAFPTAVSFQGSTRSVGETAALQKHALTQLNRLCLKNNSDNANANDNLLDAFHPVSRTEDGQRILVDYDNHSNEEGKSEFAPSALLAMLLRQMTVSAQSTLQRLEGSPSSSFSDQKPFATTLTINEINNDKQSDVASQQYLDAAYAAGLEGSIVVTTPAAYAACYQRKFPERTTTTTKSADTSSLHRVLIIDMGHSQTTLAIVEYNNNTHNDTSSTTEEAETQSASNSLVNFDIVYSDTNPHLGSGTVHARLWHYFQSTQKLSELTPANKKGARLLQGCRKLTHLLSQLPEASVRVENVTPDDGDITLTTTRAQLTDAILEQEGTVLRDMLTKVMTTSSTPFHASEIVGGGCRMPWVQSLIQEVVGADIVLSRSLDDTSAALGAALLGQWYQEHKPSTDSVPSWLLAQQPTEPTPTQIALRAAEEAMTQRDLAQAQLLELRNQLESHILEARQYKNQRPHGSLVPAEELDAFLMETEDWLFSEECDQATKDIMEQKLQATKDKTQSLCATYLEAVAKDTQAKEQEMEAAAQAAALEKNGQEEGDDDHDTRRLSKKRRMEIVMKNKAEANELFSDGNYKMAAARYTKALSHCAKFVDLAPDDVKEVNELKVSLNLNLALAYLKLQNVDQSLRVMNEAMSLEPAQSNPKAFFRRATVYYEKKNWEAAKKDVLEAQKLTNNQDKAINKLAERIDLQIKRQKQKEKKMAAKMFG